ncbi:5928_t:CDS:2 [Funneliformis geosporum]|nr:5928_t:CDS:2 [Funneliformis geosporum]
MKVLKRRHLVFYLRNLPCKKGSVPDNSGLPSKTILPRTPPNNDHK